MSFIGCRCGRGTSLIDGRIFLPVDKAGKRHWRSIAVQVGSKAENCQGAEFILRAIVRVRVPGSKQVPVNGSVSCKKRDELITPTIRVMFRRGLKLTCHDETVTQLKIFFRTLKHEIGRASCRERV